MIDAIGYRNVVISSDCGQLNNPVPAEALALFASMLLEEGMSKFELKYMFQEKPIQLLGLEK